MKKILFIAGLDLEGKNAPNGVTMRNRQIWRYICEKYDINNILLVDTTFWKIKIFQIFVKIFVFSFLAKNIIISLNSSSSYKIIRFLYLIGKCDKVIYFRAGGAFVEKIDSRKLNKKYYKMLKRIYVQTEKMKMELIKRNFHNVEYLPNFKFFKRTFRKYGKRNLPLKCFYLGRIHPDKGIEIIFEVFEKINMEKERFVLDFFGPIEEKYRNYFLNSIESYKSLSYKGVIDFNENENAYLELSEYDLFIFPTFWNGEGFPGVIIDAFICGVPVVASNWMHNREIIVDGINGMIFENKSVIDLFEKLKYVYDNPILLSKMSSNASNCAKTYHSNKVLSVIDKVLS